MRLNGHHTPHKMAIRNAYNQNLAETAMLSRAPTVDMTQADVESIARAARPMAKNGALIGRSTETPRCLNHS